jgi:hypothetical protein
MILSKTKTQNRKNFLIISLFQVPTRLILLNLLINLISHVELYALSFNLLYWLNFASLSVKDF